MRDRNRDVHLKRPVVVMPHTMVLGVAIFGTEFGNGSTELGEWACKDIRENFETQDNDTLAEVLGVPASRISRFLAGRGLKRKRGRKAK